MNQEDIYELLEEANSYLTKAQRANRITKPKVKTILEHLRTSLEYLTHDINDNFSKPSKGRFFFPYGKDRAEFDLSLKRNMPLLEDEYPAIYLLINKLQPFSCGNDWLTTMCNLTNQVKHVKPIGILEKEVSESVLISAGGMNLVEFRGSGLGNEFSGSSYNGLALDDLKINNGVVEVTKKGLMTTDFKVTKKNELSIDGIDYPLFQFLRKCHNNIRDFIPEVYEQLNKASQSDDKI
ncbi:hypothetical protein GA565_19745 [Rouxiella sp. S1S-2]|uniref:hypothetical protein n=1 Tax=Rouxiella sp. S1S-2 TaxID=2653856 RepID=UPI0012641AF9|nr:hypothetical protein [Rouxiella sp. S1S-2]KAB7898030.1 hypothetical protein GA565_19745 [Rouxiella sp. S1S-2]